jgi:excisionase family DNA binding protein
MDNPNLESGSSPPVTVTPRLLTIKQAAVYLGAAVWAVRQLLWAKEVPHIVIGRRHLIAREDLDSFIDSQLRERVQ